MLFQIQIPNERDRLEALLASIDAALAAHAIAGDLRHDVRLIAEEVVCNAMDYCDEGAVASRAPCIAVDIEVRDDGLHVEFRDNGQPFDPLSQTPPNLDADIGDRPIGGLGVHLLREIAQSVHYARKGPDNVLHVVLRIP